MYILACENSTFEKGNLEGRHHIRRILAVSTGIPVPTKNGTEKVGVGCQGRPPILTPPELR